MIVKIKQLKLVSRERGFTLIEAFIAISILLIAVIGPMSLISQSIADANYAASQITAFYLAQEGLELVINQRELNNSAGREAWLTGLDNCLDGKKCEVSLDDNFTLKTSPCDPVTGCTDPLYLDTATGIFSYDNFSARPTTFTRTITISPPQSIAVKNNGTNVDITIDAKVDSTVSWSDKGVPRSFTLSTLITD